MSWGLIIHEEPLYRALLAAFLTPVMPPTLVQAATLAEARDAMLEHGRASCRLIVSSGSPPLHGNQSQPLERMAPTLAAFLNEMRSADARPPCIVLLSVNEGERGDQLRALGNVEIVGVDQPAQVADLARKMTKATAQTAEKEVQAPQPASLAHGIDVDIYLTGQTDGHWGIKGGSGNPIETGGVIKIGWRERERLLVGSRGAEQARPEHINLLGRDMYEHLMAPPQNGGLESALAGCTRPSGSLDNVRFRFHVDEESCPMLVETLAKPRGDQKGAELDFWMLRTPIFRKFGARGVRHPLFKDQRSRREPLRCLIIQGNTSKFSAGGKLAQGFPEIANAAAETKWLEDYLGVRNQNRFNLGVPRVLRPSGNPAQSYGAEVRKVLSKGDWQLIHYVGHSAIGSDGRGYLVLGGEDDELIDIDDFARLAQHAQFVFLNSCQSADAKFIMKLIEKDIPAVAGYAWKINDKMAHVFSRSFYENLFDGEISKRFLEYSFMRARAHLHEIDKNSPVWTSPQLFMQVANAERDTA